MEVSILILRSNLVRITRPLKGIAVKDIRITIDEISCCSLAIDCKVCTVPTVVDEDRCGACFYIGDWSAA